MTKSNSLLANYQALVQNHATQFDPEIAALRQLVEARMQEVHSKEQALVSAQEVELKRITDALATDARCLLPIPEFSEFVQEYKRMSRPWYSQKSESPIADDPTTWVLTTLEIPIVLTNFQTSVDPNGYDDERTHTLYGYSVSLKLGDAKGVIEVQEKRIYNLDECREFSPREQIDFFIADYVDDVLREANYPLSEINQLTAEISVLLGYATQVFVLKPRTAVFEYTSTGED